MPEKKIKSPGKMKRRKTKWMKEEQQKVFVMCLGKKYRKNETKFEKPKLSPKIRLEINR